MIFVAHYHKDFWRVKTLDCFKTKIELLKFHEDKDERIEVMTVAHCNNPAEMFKLGTVIANEDYLRAIILENMGK